jgi:hypothetical protein
LRSPAAGAPGHRFRSEPIAVASARATATSPSESAARSVSDDERSRQRDGCPGRVRVRYLRPSNRVRGRPLAARCSPEPAAASGGHIVYSV